MHATTGIPYMYLKILFLMTCIVMNSFTMYGCTAETGSLDLMVSSSDSADNLNDSSGNENDIVSSGDGSSAMQSSPVSSEVDNDTKSSFDQEQKSSGEIQHNSSSTLSFESESSAMTHLSSALANEFDPNGDRLQYIAKKCNSVPSKITAGESGWNSRYWDCCKPHCSGPGNTDYLNMNCSVDDQEMEAYRVIEEEWHSWNKSVESGCVVDGEAFTCYSQSPYAVCEDLAYGYAAVPGGVGAVCGSCYQLDFDGGSRHGDPKPAHGLMKGKTMIVMASNIGYDVSTDGQFDIMIPGGGVGAYDGGCAAQWGVDVDNEPLVGKKYGGFISTCQDIHGYDADVDVYKDCVRGMCDALFGSDPGMHDLWQGCVWYVDWMHTADNPTFTYTEVECPQELINGYESTFH